MNGHKQRDLSPGASAAKGTWPEGNDALWQNTEDQANDHLDSSLKYLFIDLFHVVT